MRIGRPPEDLYQNNDFPNYRHVKFVLDEDTLRAKMFRLADADTDSPSWQARDEFTINAR